MPLPPASDRARGPGSPPCILSSAVEQRPYKAKAVGSIPTGCTTYLKMKQIGDPDTWENIPLKHLWVIDKLILAKRLGYLCGPAGVPVPVPGEYIVRPCINFEMMSKGARVAYLTPEDSAIPTGYFWCTRFKGRHLSFDFNFGRQTLAVEGFRDSDRLDRFSRWKKIDMEFALPPLLKTVADDVEWFNVEVVDGAVIECHFRYNDDFTNHDADEIIPVWKDEFYASACGDRLGFLLKGVADPGGPGTSLEN